MNRFTYAVSGIIVLAFSIGIVAVPDEGLSRGAKDSDVSTDAPCVLCAGDPGVSVVRMTEAWLD